MSGLSTVSWPPASNCRIAVSKSIAEPVASSAVVSVSNSATDNEAPAVICSDPSPVREPAETSPRMSRVAPGLTTRPLPTSREPPLST